MGIPWPGGTPGGTEWATGPVATGRPDRWLPTERVTLIASGPLSYTNSADFSRYLPRTTSPKAIVGWTSLGGFLPSVVVTSLGASAATAVDMTDTLYTGPLARTLGGVDLALPVGIAVASAVYATLMRRSRDGLGMVQRA